MEFKARCSGIADIVSNPKAKSPAQIYDETKERLTKLNDTKKLLESRIKRDLHDLNEKSDKASKTAIRLFENIEKWKTQKKECISQIESTAKELTSLERGKDDIVLSDTCLSHLRKWYNYQKYKRRKDLETKTIKKGIFGEEDSTTLLNKIYAKDYGYKLFVTSKDRDVKRITNDFITGECDIHIKSHKHVRDIKTSWDLQTFPGGPFAKPNPEDRYVKQVKGYIELWECELGFIDYCLIDTPVQLVSDEISRLNWKYHIASIDTNQNDQMEIDEEHIPLVVEKVSNMIYTERGLKLLIADPAMKFDIKLEWFKDFVEIPEKERVVTYHVERDEDFIQGKVYDRVRLIREYIKQKGVSFENLKKAA